MKCNHCGTEFVSTHPNQRLCSEACRKVRRRENNARYEKTPKGHLAERRWRRNPRKHEIDRGYRTSDRGRAVAVNRMTRYLRDKWWVRVQKRLRDTAPYKRLRQQLIGEIGACQACGSTADLTIDHIIPIALGGVHTRNNIQLLCRSCNARKKQEVIRYEMPQMRE